MASVLSSGEFRPTKKIGYLGQLHGNFGLPEGQAGAIGLRLTSGQGTFKLTQETFGHINNVGAVQNQTQ